MRGRLRLRIPAKACERMWPPTTNMNYFEFFRRHAALDVGAIEDLCLLLAPCLTTKIVGNIVEHICGTPS